MNKKNTLRAFSVFTGTLIGAGFASGKETEAYFIRNGEISILSFITSFLIFFAMACICVKAGEKAGKNNEFYEYIFGKNLAAFLFEAATKAFIFVLFCAMSAACAQTAGMFGLNKEYARLIFIAVCILSAAFGAEGITKINSVLVPFLLTAMLLCAYEALKDCEMPKIIFTDKSLSPAAFSFYNMSTCVPVLIECQKKFGSKTERNTGLLFSAGFVTLLNMLLAYIITGKNVCEAEFPMLKAMEGGKTEFLYLAAFGTAIFTTACANACVLYKRKGNKGKDVFYAVLFAILAFFVSKISFSVFVEKIYCIFSAMGTVLAAFSLKAVLRCKKQKN